MVQNIVNRGPNIEKKKTTAVFKLGNAATTTAATKTSLKKWIRAASSLIALIPSRSILQMLAIISEVEF